MEIISRNTYYKIEDDILTIAFADSEKGYVTTNS